MRELEGKRIQTRMLFAGNILHQPNLTRLAAERCADGAPAPFRVAGSLTNSDIVMHRSFWIGVFPGLSPAMRQFVAETIRNYVGQYTTRV